MTSITPLPTIWGYSLTITYSICGVTFKLRGRMMKHLTKSISILALGVSLAFVAPGQLPTAENNYSIWAEAEACGHKRKRTKERIRIRWPIKTTSSSFLLNENGEIGIEDKIFRIDGEFVYSYTDNSPDSETIYFDWIAPEGYVPGPVSLGCDDCGDDAFSDLAIDLSVAHDWGDDHDSEEDLGKGVDVEGCRLDDSTYRIAVSGASKTINKDICLEKVKGKGVCGNYPTRISVDGSDANLAFVDHYWEQKLPGNVSKEIIDTKIISEVSIIGENGEVLDTSISTVPVGEVPDSDGFGAFEYGIGPDGTLELTIISEATDPQGGATLTASIFSEDFSTALIDVTEAEAEVFREFYLPEVYFTESDNVIDQDYIIQAVLFDEFGNYINDNFIYAKGSEPDGTCSLPENDVITDELLTYTTLSLNEDGETFAFNLGLQGEAARNVASVEITIMNEGGGSDADPDQYLIEDSVLSNAWLIKSDLGPESGELAAGSTNLQINGALSIDGSVQEVAGGSEAGTGLVLGKKRRFRSRDKKYREKSGCVTMTVYSSNGGDD